MKNKWVLLVAGIVLALLIGEGVVRCFHLAPVMLDSHIIYSLFFVDDPDILYKMRSTPQNNLNSDGYRDDEFVLQKPEDYTRIIMLGDSITYGFPVRRDETFSFLLEKQLNNVSLNAHEVMNFGVGGYNIVSSVATLKKYGTRYNPDIVIYNFFWNDDEIYSYDYYNFFWKKTETSYQKRWAHEYYLPTASVLKRFLLRMHLFSFLWIRGFELSVAVWNKAGDHSPLEIEQQFDLIETKITELHELATKNGFALMLCMHPVLNYDVADAHPNYQKTKEIASDLEIPVVDLLPHYKAVSSDPSFFLADKKDVFHPNAAGHQLIANVLEDRLKFFDMLSE